MPPKEKNIRDPSSPAVHTRSKQKEQEGGHVRRDENGEPETPTTRTRRKLKEGKRKAAKHAKLLKLLETAREKEPAETLEEESGKKRRVVGSGKNKAKRKKNNTAKAKKGETPTMQRLKF